MANYTTLRRGSTGNEVKKLQEKLGFTGADVDGIYGEKTEKAVRDYQEKNGLAKDGIAGSQTQGHMYETAAQTPAQSQTATAPATATAQTPVYRYEPEKDTVYQQALQQLQGAKENAPVYAGTFDEQLQQIYDKIMAREPFEYDLNGDALWKQYKDQYVQAGQMAMQDTVGQAAALTGGYGSSYAQNVGQQAYQGYLQKLNDLVPELYQLATNRYQQEGDQLSQQFAMTGQLQADEYAKYQDAQSQYWQNVDRAQAAADTAYSRGQDSWYTEQQLKQQADETAYGRQQDAYSRLVDLISSTGYTPSREELTAAGMSDGEAAAYLKYYNDQSAVRYVAVSDPETQWGAGIDTERKSGEGQLKGSAWDYSKNNLKTLLRNGNYDAADRYMEMILDDLSEEQYEEIMDLYSSFGYQ